MKKLTIESVIEIVEDAVNAISKQRTRKTGSKWDNEFARIRRKDLKDGKSAINKLRRGGRLSEDENIFTQVAVFEKFVNDSDCLLDEDGIYWLVDDLLEKRG